jgi:NADPH:quinone reductase-like Zn-dependent oxidoreductase
MFVLARYPVSVSAPGLSHVNKVISGARTPVKTICRSDTDHARGDWRSEPYRLGSGHEISEIITEVGSEVSRYSDGDRVGAGCVIDSWPGVRQLPPRGGAVLLHGGPLTHAAVDKDGTITQERLLKPGWYAVRYVTPGPHCQSSHPVCALGWLARR